MTKKSTNALLSGLITCFLIALFGVSASGVSAASQNLKGLRLTQEAAAADPSQILELYPTSHCARRDSQEKQ